MLKEVFAKSSEKMDPAQLQLALEGMREADEELLAQAEAETSAFPDEPPKKPTRSKRASFPEALREEVIEIDLPEADKICPRTGQPRTFIRWEESIKYNFVPGHFVRLRIKRAVYASPCGEADPLPEQPVVTAPMPAEYRVIPGCMAAAGLLVYLIVAKFVDHLPLYRLQHIFKRRHRVEIDRGTMCHWIKRSAEILEVLYQALRRELLSGNYLQIDETFIKLLDPDTKGQAKQSHFWVIKKPGTGVLFHFSPSRDHRVAQELLGGFTGRLQSDGYSAYQTLLGKMPGLIPFYCWAHVRRKFVESIEANGAEAAWYVAEIQRLYRVEKQLRETGICGSERAPHRQEHSRPVLEGIKARLERDLAYSEILPSSPLGKAIRYTLPLWPGLTRYAEADHGEVEIDTNQTENAIRPTAVGKKNWLFIGHPNAGQNSAIIYTIVENCRMWDIDPMEYLIDVLPRIMDHPASRIQELLPQAWKEAREASAAA